MKIKANKNKMTLDEIPIIRKDLIEARVGELNSYESRLKMIREVSEYIEKIPPLNNAIEKAVYERKDPEEMLTIFYSVLYLLNEQIAAERLKKELNMYE